MHGLGRNLSHESFGPESTVLMPVENSELVKKRKTVGVIAVVCLGIAVVAGLNGELQSAWYSACLRVGLVMGALWLALPTRKRPAAWAHLSKWWLMGIAVTAIVLPRIRGIWPVLLVGFMIGWLLRPRRRR